MESAPSLPPYMNYLENFLSTIIPRFSGLTPRSNNGRALLVDKNHTRVAGCSLPDVVKQKSAFQHTYFSNNK